MKNNRFASRVFLCVLVLAEGGCTTMHGAWKGSKDMLVGTKFDPLKERNEETRGLYTKYLKAERIEGRFFYRVEHEPPNTRYYIQSGHACRYSIVVNSDSIILSWRYEDVENPRWDCVTS